MTEEQFQILVNCLKTLEDAGFSTAVLALIPKKGRKVTEYSSNVSFIGSEKDLYSLFHGIGTAALKGTCEPNLLSSFRSIASGMMCSMLQDEEGRRILKSKMEEQEEQQQRN